MRTEALIKAIDNGSFDEATIVPAEVNPHEIMSIPSTEVLRALAAHAEKFLFLSNTETWQKDASRQYILGAMDQLNVFLREMSSNGCRCLKYKYVKCHPESEERNGLVRILKRSKRDFDREFECECTICGTQFSVAEQEVRFGHQFLWFRGREMQLNPQLQPTPIGQ